MAMETKTPQGPISGALHSYLVELAAQIQTLPDDAFEKASAALKGAMAETTRVSELEQHVTVNNKEAAW